MENIIKKLELAENQLTGEPSEENAAEALLLIKDVLQILRQTDIVSSFYCQRSIEGEDECDTQCEHCKEYYAPLEK
jgi:hypothetical protein